MKHGFDFHLTDKLIATEFITRRVKRPDLLTSRVRIDNKYFSFVWLFMINETFDYGFI